MLGHPREVSTVTAVSVYPGLQQLHCARSTPEGLLDTVVDAISTDEFFRGTYVLLVSPQHAAVFHEHGWTKQRVKDYLWTRCRRSVADLKRRGNWGVMADKPDGFADFSREVQPGDETRLVGLFEPNQYDHVMQAQGALERGTDIYVVVGGGSAPSFTAAAAPEHGRTLFDYAVSQARQRLGPRVPTGRFGSHMQVSLTSDGPVTFWLRVGPSAGR